MKIVDKTGSLYTSSAWYPLIDPISGHRFEPGELTKIDPNPWIAGQPAIEPQADLETPEKKPVALKSKT